MVFSSPASHENVEKYFQNLQVLLTSTAPPVVKDIDTTEEDSVVGYPVGNLKSKMS